MMEEKIILERQFEGTSDDVIEVMNAFFTHEGLFTGDIDFRAETNGNSVSLVTQPKGEKPKIIHGYVDINPLSGSEKPLIYVRIVSCRPILNLWFLHLTQSIEAKFLAPDFTADAVVLPWHTLVSHEEISKENQAILDILNNSSNPAIKKGRNGRYGNLSDDVIKHICDLCRYMKKTKGLSYKDFYFSNEFYQENFSLDTFLKYMKNKKFK